MQKRYRVKPGRVPSGVGFVVGLVFVLIGVLVIIPLFSQVGSGMGFSFPRIFAILWTCFAVVMTAFHGFNMLSSKGTSVLDVEVDERGSGGGGSANRLRELERMREEKLVSDDEYARKREEILHGL